MTRREFYEAALKRLDAGYAEYGDRSFFRSTDELVREVTEELLDVAVWLSIMMSPAASDEPNGGGMALMDVVLDASMLASRVGRVGGAARTKIGGTQAQAAQWLRRALLLDEENK